MKKNVLSLSLVLLLASLWPGGLAAGSGVETPGAHILLVNPSLGDLEDMVSMIELGIIPIEHPRLTAVYGAAVERNGAVIRNRFAERQLSWVDFAIIEGELLPETLFRENPCSADFMRLFRASDAALFYGGADIPPAVYGQKTDLLTGIATPDRHYFELSFLFHLLGGRQNPDFKPFLAEKPGYVIRGFCLGMQTINVATGGTMVQDIPSEIYNLRYVEEYLALPAEKRHDNYWSKLAPHENLFWCHFQPIRFAAKGLFVEEMGLGINDHPLVCSSHHQAVKKLGRDLEAAAVSLDGKVVEAITHKRFKNVLGVQFHPENLAIYQPMGEGSKFTPADTVLVSMHDFLKAAGGSYEFHLKLWQQFASLLQK
jgi:putative glutamine amidotransferase